MERPNSNVRRRRGKPEPEPESIPTPTPIDNESSNFQLSIPNNPSSNENNNIVNIVICDGSNKLPITMSELGLNPESTLLDLREVIKTTPTITDRIKASCFNFHKIIWTEVNNLASRCLNKKKYK